MTLIEVAIYALVLANPGPALCRLGEPARVTCSNGLAADILSVGAARFNNGVTVRRDDDGFPVFSNGITSRLSNGWLRFSNGVGVRRVALSRYDFDNGISCRAELPELVDCARHAADPGGG